MIRFLDAIFGSGVPESCERGEHEWSEYTTEMTHPQNIYHEEGQPFIHKLEVQGKECAHCHESEVIESTEKKIHLAVEKVEEVE